MEPKWGLESIFIAIENDVKKVRLFREGVEGLGLAGPWARAPGHPFRRRGLSLDKTKIC